VLEVKKEKEMTSRFRRCVLQCDMFIKPNDTHDLCVICLGIGQHSMGLAVVTVTTPRTPWQQSTCKVISRNKMWRVRPPAPQHLCMSFPIWKRFAKNTCDSYMFQQNIV